MKQSEPLSVMGDYSFDDKTINIHPNDGFDLGLMTTQHVVHICTGCSYDEFVSGTANATEGVIHLKNECRANTVELSSRTVERLGKPRKIVLVLQDGRLLLQPA